MIKIKALQPFKLCIIILLGCFSAASCQSNDESNIEVPFDNASGEKIINLKIQENNIFQTIENFGASDAWSAQFVGKWPEEKKNIIADLLFSKEIDQEGNPIGIGLSLWRFNLGAGSASQGAASGISDPWRRGESFIVPETGKYDWDKMQGQVWFANAAKSRGVEKLLLFTNSPPVTITRNGKAFTSDSNQSNLSPEHYDEFADYLADVVEGLSKKGLHVDYISPVNEPQWDWTGGQEGTPFWNNEITRIVKALNSELINRNLTPKIDISEAGQINYLFEQGNKPGRSEQIMDFFEPSSENYVGNLEKIGHSISGHSYFTTSPYPSMISVRKMLKSEMESVPDLNYWMSEYCILGDNNGEIQGNGRDLGINPALYLARVIHTDLTVAEASAWHWWTAISAYDYKDGLVYVDKNIENGNYYDSKMLWALGNFSRFIRPGSQRIQISSPDSSNKDFLFSAYKNPETGEKIIVIVNSKFDEIPVKLQDTSASSLEAYVTSSSKDLEKTDLNSQDIINIPSRSIVTLLLK
ncbi:xylanase [Christiangramia fulva]|uniref:Xylanase n=1 Tax=Christiangramia fulva TaxID=2126553 RepID=A0A2R3Z5V2_9FLAO|nr:glycoside hydrolase family 30 protein [Christiangramia fulva]AVR45592.1 xylanase [Christiangramia fulva]